MGNGEKKEKEKASCRGVTSEDGACVRVLCVFQGPDLCVCVCVQVRRNVKCVSPPCVFFRGASRIETLNYVARSSPFFLPPTFLLQTGATTCGPESESIFHEKSV